MSATGRRAGEFTGDLDAVGGSRWPMVLAVLAVMALSSQALISYTILALALARVINTFA